MSATLTHRPEFVRAAQSAITLGTSLLAGIACSMAVRVALPRVLGPAAFGEYRLVETVAELVLVILTLGLDTALRRDVARDPSTAGAQLANVLLLRTYGGIALIAMIIAGFWLSGASVDRLVLLALLAAAQLMLALNNTHAAVAHGIGDVRWNAVASVVARAAWATLSLTVLAIAPSPLPVALAFLAVETVRFVLQQRRATTLYNMRAVSPDMRRALGAAAASLPLFVNFLAHNFYGRLGTWWLGSNASAAEVGWYGAAANISSAALVGMPLVTWVLLPAASREGATSSAATDGLVAGALRVALLVATPAALLLAALSPTLVVVLFGAAFAPAATALSLLAPTIALAYGSTVCAVSLIQRGEERSVAAVSVAGLVLSVVLTAVLVHPGAPGDAATRAALSALLTEVIVTAVLARLAWRQAWTASLARAAAGIVAAVAAALITSRLVAGHGVPALAAASAAYLLTLVISGTVGMPDVRFAQQVFSRGRSRAALA
jgi:O-antigen/teichoic acid export membrane protein